MDTGAPKAALPAMPTLLSAAGGNRFGFADFEIQDLGRKKLYRIRGCLDADVSAFVNGGIPLDWDELEVGSQADILQCIIRLARLASVLSMPSLAKPPVGRKYSRVLVPQLRGGQ
ncbi:hypothetical protein [Shinella sp.]|jgi:hypothetical protein|uniref:hypothetical protein n=1 Tax=Shinella sp. TaxID=1870904 RepID=UPI0029A00AE2|nr:hypothetical protein [Shinella sp.]MDX3977656.1 hypothetical protein [Shinella sp.]